MLVLSPEPGPGPEPDSGPHLEFAPSVELLKLSLGGVHVGEASSLSQDPGMIQGLPDAETLTGVQDDQLTDLTKDRDRTDSRTTSKARVRPRGQKSRDSPGPWR